MIAQPGRPQCLPLRRRVEPKIWPLLNFDHLLLHLFCCLRGSPIARSVLWCLDNSTRYSGKVAIAGATGIQESQRGQDSRCRGVTMRNPDSLRNLNPGTLVDCVQALFALLFFCRGQTRAQGRFVWLANLLARVQFVLF